MNTYELPESETVWSAHLYRCSVAKSCQTLHNPMNYIVCQAPLSFTTSQSLLRFMSIELVMLSNHLILCYPLLLLPSFFPRIRVFSNESTVCLRWTKYLSFSFSISPTNEYSGLISFKDWLAWSPWVPRDSQESSPTPQLKSIHSSALHLLYGPTFTSVHDYWKNHSFNYTKVMSLLFNMLSRFVIAFLPRSKGLLISWLAVTISSDFGAQENKICHCFHKK